MLVSGFAVLFLIFSMGIQSSHSQFYVDIEHALPRFGKRNENTYDDANLYVVDKNENKVNVHELKSSILKAINLLRILGSKKTEETQQ